MAGDRARDAAISSIVPRAPDSAVAAEPVPVPGQPPPISPSDLPQVRRHGKRVDADFHRAKKNGMFYPRISYGSGPTIVDFTDPATTGGAA